MHNLFSLVTLMISSTTLILKLKKKKEKKENLYKKLYRDIPDVSVILAIKLLTMYNI